MAKAGRIEGWSNRSGEEWVESVAWARVGVAGRDAVGRCGELAREARREAGALRARTRSNEARRAEGRDGGGGEGGTRVADGSTDDGAVNGVDDAIDDVVTR